MTKTIDEMVAVMLAAKDGKKIQFLGIRDSEGRPLPNMEWTDWGPNPFQWDWIRFDYRVKPEPRRVYINEYKDCFGSFTWSKTEPVGETYLRTITFVEELP